MSLLDNEQVNFILTASASGSGNANLNMSIYATYPTYTNSLPFYTRCSDSGSGIVPNDSGSINFYLQSISKASTNANLNMFISRQPESSVDFFLKGPPYTYSELSLFDCPESWSGWNWSWNYSKNEWNCSGTTGIPINTIRFIMGASCLTTGSINFSMSSRNFSGHVPFFTRGW